MTAASGTIDARMTMIDATAAYGPTSVTPEKKRMAPIATKKSSCPQLIAATYK